MQEVYNLQKNVNRIPLKLLLALTRLRIVMGGESSPPSNFTEMLVSLQLA